MSRKAVYGNSTDTFAKSSVKSSHKKHPVDLQDEATEKFTIDVEIMRNEDNKLNSIC